MILLWGRPGERPLAEVRDALARRGAEMFFLNEARAPVSTLRFGVGQIGAGELCVDGRRLDLADVSAAYFRPYGTDDMLSHVELTRRGEVRYRIESFAASLWAWADVTDAAVVNRPSLMNSNASKPLQALLLASLGFEIPATLLTNDSQIATAFAEKHGRVIYKSISAVRSIVTAIDKSDLTRLQNLGVCPVQFQASIPGTDVRVHVVGDDLFACEITSGADDYRYAGRNGLAANLVPCTLPVTVAERCHRASVVLGLPLCGIDLRRTPDGAWVAFEVNPSPGFSYFAAATGAPIADAIATLLAAGAAPGSRSHANRLTSASA